MAERSEVITLLDEEGRTHEFSLVDVLEVEARRYAILQPAEGGEPAQVFRVEGDTLHAVDDETEFRRVARALEALDEYDEIEIEDDTEGADSRGGEDGGGPVM